MGRIRALAAALFAVLIGACNVFLGPEADTDPHSVLKSLWNDFNETHAYIDIRMSYKKKSWDDVYRYYSDELLKRIPKGGAGGHGDGRILFDVCCSMLGELNDPHVSLYVPGGHFWTSGDKESKDEENWCDLSRIREYYLENGGIDKASYFLYGRFKVPDTGNIGYIHIASFTDSDTMMQQGWVREIDGITKYFQDEKIKAVIIDVRNNRGGLSPAAEYIAARFCSVQKNYMKSSAKNGPGRNDFSDPMTFRVKPEGTVFTKPTALLTNMAAASAAEWFVLAMKTQSHVTHMGTRTRGALSAKTARPMLNGWYYTISAYRVTDIDGNCYEGKGISPDEKYDFTGNPDGEGTTDEPKKDRQLEKVLKIVREWVNP